MLIPADKHGEPRDHSIPVPGFYDICEDGGLRPARLPAQFETDERLEAADLYRRHEEARQ